ncbi:hypothetical protein C7271_19260 [filamentous cyanobacterium CCP5]|nr:hypothetical protein C7271_19260 [filamentous cyanobacterium CCP5]
MADVFISYSRRDKAFVEVLHDALVASKYQAWIDWQDIAATAEWWKEIEAGIEKAHTFIFVISPDSVTSKYCLDEVDYARERNKRIIPVLRRNAELPKSFSHIQWLPFRETDPFEPAFEQLVAAINTDLEHNKTHTRLENRAIEWAQKNRDGSLLLRGSELEAAEQWLIQAGAAQKEPKPTDLQVEYVSASAAGRRLANNRQRAAIGVLAMLLLLAIGAGGVAFVQYRTAQAALTEKDDALTREENARELAEQRLQEAEAARELAQQAEAGEAAQRQVAEEKQQEAEDALTQAKAAQKAETQQRQRAEAARQRAEAGEAEAERQKDFAQTETLRAEEATERAEAEAFNADIQAESLRIKNLMASNLNFKALLAGLKLGQQIQRAENRGLTSRSITLADRLRQVAKTDTLARLPPQHKLRPEVRLQAAAALREIYNYPGYLHRNTFKAHTDWVRSVAFALDSETLASASDDGTVKLWNISGELLQTLSGHIADVNSVAFAPDSETLASASDDGTVKLWNISGELLQTLTGHTDPVNDVSYAPNGEMLASASDDGTVKLWNTDGLLLQTLVWHPHPDDPDDVNIIRRHSHFNSVSFSPNNQFLASADDSGRVMLWNIDGRLLQTLEDDETWEWGSEVVINSVSFAPNGETLASAGNDGKVKIWGGNYQLLQALRVGSYRPLEPQIDDVNSVSFAPTDQTLASASNDGTIKIWSENRQLLQTIDGHIGPVSAVSFAPNDQSLASAGADGTVKLWDRSGRSPQALYRYELFPLSSTGRSLHFFRSVSFAPDGQVLASGSLDGTVHLWGRDGQLLQTFEGHEDGVYSVSFAPDGQVLASASADGTVKLWNRSGQLLKIFEGHEDGVYSVSFAPPDGQIIASGSYDGTVKLWSRSGQLLQTLDGHKAGAYAVSFPLDGQTVASGSYDGTVKLWSRSGQLLQTLDGHKDSVTSVSFSPDGQTIASASRDGTVILWNFDLDDLMAKSCTWLRDYMTNPTTPAEHKELCENEIPELRSTPLGWLAPIQRAFASLTGPFQTTPASRR